MADIPAMTSMGTGKKFRAQGPPVLISPDCQQFCSILRPGQCTMNKYQTCRDEAVYSPLHTFDLFCHTNTVKIGSD